MKTLLKLSSLALVLLAPCLDAAPRENTVTFLGQEWHPNAARKGVARGEAEFLRTRDGTAYLEKLTAVGTELNEVHAKYVNISRVDPDSEEGKRLRKERNERLKIMQERKKKIEVDYANLKKASKEYRDIMERHLQQQERAERAKEEKTKALQQKAKAARK